MRAVLKAASVEDGKMWSVEYKRKQNAGPPIASGEVKMYVW